MKQQKHEGDLASTLSGARPEQNYTSQQIADWKRYEKVRVGGRFNMFDPRARTATGLSEERYLFVLRNFSELKARATGKTDSAGHSDSTTPK